MKCSLVVAIAVGAICLAGPSQAAFPFVENFNESAENWRTSAGAVNANWVATGGPDGGPYISNTFANFDPPPSPFPGGSSSSIVLRAQEEYGGVGSSNGGYTGDWITAGIKRVTAWVRHNAEVNGVGVPLAYNFRFSDPANSPGASYGTATVPSGVWTQLVIDVTPSSSQLLSYGGGSHATIYDNIGHIQVSAVEPAGWSAATVTFDLDRVAVEIPEPAAVALAGAGLIGIATAAYRRRK
jgi:hypothetical protein